MKKNKIIGIIANRDDFFRKTSEGAYIQKLYYSIPSLIIDNIKNINLNPCIIIPYQENFISFYTNLIDGLILVGSDHNIPPHFYGEDKKFDMKSCHEKSSFEINFLKEFLLMNKPVIGICAGMQTINVVKNGNLYQDIQKELNLNHEQQYDMCKVNHKIKIIEKTKLFDIFKEKETQINSYHNQGIKKIGENIIISAISEDNIIEAIELNNHKFCLGVQWHPEFNSNPKDKLIFDYFQENL